MPPKRRHSLAVAPGARLLPPDAAVGASGIAISRSSGRHHTDRALTAADLTADFQPGMSSVRAISAPVGKDEFGRRKSEPTAAIVKPEKQMATEKTEPSRKRPSTDAMIKSPTERICHCFQVFDDNNDGKITRDELGTLLKMLDKDGQLDESLLQRVMDEVDTSQDGFIDYAEFLAWLQGDHCLPNSRPLHDHAQALLNEETPEERLHRCMREMREGVAAAIPPRATEVTLVEADMWIFTKKGESLDDTRGFKEPTIVHQISPTMDQYRKGVRKGDRIVTLNDRSVPLTVSCINQIVKGLGGGGGASRSIVVGFVSLALLEAQEAAQERLALLVEALEKAKAALKPKVDVVPTGGISSVEQILIKYYNNEVMVPTHEGCLAAAEIDELFGISRIMPTCSLFLAEECKSDEHIKSSFMLSPAVIAAKENGFKRSELDRVDGIFRNLVQDKTYFLVVDPGAKSQEEVKWRARQERKQELERFEALPPHDCEKERISFCMNVETEVGEFDIELDNRQGVHLGMNTTPDSDGVSLRVEDVMSFGLINLWNSVNPTTAVKTGDRITEINGVRRDGKLLTQELKRKGISNLKIRRVDFEIGDFVEALYKNGVWYEAHVTQDKKDGTFEVQWFDGRAEDRRKNSFELRRVDEMQDARHKTVRGKYWFIGSYHGRVMYRNVAGAIISFHKYWRINLSEESEYCFYSAPGETGVQPPRSGMLCPANPGRIAYARPCSGKVCRICTLPHTFDTVEDTS